MGMTMSQKILAAHAGQENAKAGEFVDCALDLVMANDITAPVAIRQFAECGGDRVFDPEKVIFVPDHFVPNKDIASATQAQCMRNFVREQGLRYYYEVGRGGIEHALLPEKGHIAPGDAIIGGDSHTCTYGALNAFSAGVGSTDIAAAMIVGKTWFRVPTAIRVELRGHKRGMVSGKDVILHLIGLIGTNGATYRSLEVGGEGLADMSMDDRFTFANMGVEAGAKNCIFEFDSVTEAYLTEHGVTRYRPTAPDPDAVYERVVRLELDRIGYTVAKPSLPSNTAPAETLRSVRIDQAVIGSCTNGRLSDLRAAAEVLRGRRAADSVRLIVIPATQRIYAEAVREGLVDVFLAAGAVVSTPTCGCCLGGHMGVLAEGEVCVSTTNRNFVGRMGHVSSQVYLASPAVAAASAVAGHIETPEGL